jgi:hypothetical protein
MPLSLRDRCDPTKGGDPAICNRRVSNPFRGIEAFAGTAFFSAATRNFSDLARPFPEFGTITENQRNDGRLWYNSLQAVVTRRYSKGLILNGTYTFSKTMQQALGDDAFIDSVARTPNRAIYQFDRPHRLTLSGVYALPIGKNRRLLSHLNGFLDRIVGGWEMAGSWIYQSGTPWKLPDGVDLVVDPRDAHMDLQLKGSGFIQGIRPCFGTRNSSQQIVLTDKSQQAGCTQAFFVHRDSFVGRTTPTYDARFRRPTFKQFDMNFAKRTSINEKLNLQLRLEIFNVFNSPVWDRLDFERSVTSDEFGTINKVAKGQSNNPRQIQLAMKLVF